METVLSYGKYFIAGFIYDVLVVLYYYVINDKSISKAFIITMALTMFQYIFLQSILISGEFLGNLVAFAFGCSLATSVMVYLRKIGKIKF